MEKRTIISIVISILFLIVAALFVMFWPSGSSGTDAVTDSGSGDNILDGITIENPDPPFKITLPSDWEEVGQQQRKAGPSGGAEQGSSAGSESSGFQEETIVLQLEPYDGTVSVTIKKYQTEWDTHEEYMSYLDENALKDRFEAASPIELISIEETMLGSFETYRTHYYRDIGEGAKEQVMSTFAIPSSKVMISIDYVAPDDLFESTFDEANAIIDSLDFT